MRPAWRLAIKNLSVRRSRTALLIATVALSAALIAAVACAMASVNEGLKLRVAQTVGAADMRIAKVGRKFFDDDVLKQVEAWPEVDYAVGRVQEALALKNPQADEEHGETIATIGNGLMPDREYKLRPLDIVEGRAVEHDGEVVLEAPAAEKLGAHVGDVLDVHRFGEPMTLTVVGIAKRPALSQLARWESYTTLNTMWQVAGRNGTLREIDIVLKDSSKAEHIAETRAKELEKGLVLRPSSKITSGLDKNVEGSNVGMIVASVLSFLSAAFIIMTGMTTSVSERQRELAVLRCIGGRKGQLAESQLAIGLIIGVSGAAIGVPVGIAGAWALVNIFREDLPGGFAISWLGMVLSVGGAIVAGFVGALWPAMKASRTTPLEAMAVRARPASIRGIVICGVLGLALAAGHISIFKLLESPDAVFWTDLSVGLPSMFTGYFLMAVPLMVVAAVLAGPVISRVLGLPRSLLTRTVLTTPYRFGFTAGAMMTGLALLVAIWTNMRAISRDWLGMLEFPDAFVAGVSMTEKTQDRIEELPFVRGTVAITMQNFRTTAFGVRAFDNQNTTFVGFEPGPFFRMTRLNWIEGDPQTAEAKLEQGGAVLVAREFHVSRGISVGDHVTLMRDDKPYDFEVVGVVDSPGLDVVSKFFDVGEEYLDQAVNAVFGSRDDLKRLFGNDSIGLIQIDLDPAKDDQEAMQEIRRLAGSEVVAAGSGREIKEEIRTVLSSAMLMFSLVAIAAMLVACLGVANLIIAGIQARTFEFGVLRAIGAQRGLLARLVLGEALLIALTACVVGTAMGIQGAWAGQRMYEKMLGLLLQLQVPVDAVAAGWCVLTLITVAAALPAVLALLKKEPRELLATVRG